MVNATAAGIREAIGLAGLALRRGLGGAGLEVRRARVRPYRPATLREEPVTLLDVGAASGTPALYAAYPGARVVAIDPIAEQLARLRPQLAGRDAEFVEVAVGEVEGEAELMVDETNLLKSSLQQRTALTRSPGRLLRRVVPVRRLDGLVAEHGWPGPFALKIDTEGFELDVLRGAARTLEHTVVVHCEMSLGRRFEGGYRFRDVAGLLIDAGFDLVDVLEAPRGPDGRIVFLEGVWARPEEVRPAA